MSAATRSRLRLRQFGLTLVEIMVAMVVSLILLGGVIQIFVSSKTTYRTDNGLARMQENGRFALSFLTKDVRMAGYFGCLSKDMKITNTVNHAPNDLLYDFQQGIFGYDGTSNLPSLISSLNPVSGSDIIVVKRAGGDAMQLDKPYMNTSAADIHLLNNPNSTLQVGDIAMISDCADASIFQISQFNGGNTNVVHNTGGSTSPGNSTKNLGKTYAGDATMMKAETIIYYVAPSTADNTKRSLYQKIGDAATQELVEGIENMQVIYGVDSDENGTANSYVAAGAVTDWTQVVSVKLAVLADSIDNSLPVDNTRTYDLLGTTIDPPDDRLQRQVFTTTVTLRNRAIL